MPLDRPRGPPRRVQVILQSDENAMKQHSILVLGGTGFVGRHLLYRLSREGYRCRVATRHPQRHRELALIPGCETRALETWSAAALAEAMQGCTTLINLAGILSPGGGRTFDGTHVDLVRMVTEAAGKAGILRYLHLSALNADASRGTSEYLRSKGRGEQLAFGAMEQGMAVTVFRPSVIFGPGDRLFNRFARLLPLLPGVFPLARAEARCAPVFVGDVVAALTAALRHPDSVGRTYELCGPRTVSVRELVEYTAACMGRPVRVIALNERLARLQARITERLPGRPFGLDLLLTLRQDSLCRQDGLAALEIRPRAFETVVPGYLDRRG